MIIADKYRIIEEIGRGSFGTVYRGVYCKNEEMVAIKTEPLRTLSKLLKHETRLLKYLHEKGCDFIPVVHWFGVDDEFTYLVMTCYECSLKDCFETVAKDEKLQKQIMRGCISILEHIHKNFVVHRDIKPANFMLKGRKLYIIDFGLATFFLDENREHISGTSSTIVGSLKYASYFIHDGCVNSRRDDLISLGYMFLAISSHPDGLPWSDLCVLDDGKMQNSVFHSNNLLRKEMKSWNNLEGFCSNEKIRKYMEYCYSLKIDDTPLYDCLEKIFDTD